MDDGREEGRQKRAVEDYMLGWTQATKRQRRGNRERGGDNAGLRGRGRL